MEKYIVRHPNFDEYLQLLAKPFTRYYSEDDINEVAITTSHNWVKNIEAASKFETAFEAREQYTSPLCSTAIIVEGKIVNQFN